MTNQRLESINTNPYASPRSITPNLPLHRPRSWIESFSACAIFVYILTALSCLVSSVILILIMTQENFNPFNLFLIIFDFVAGLCLLLVTPCMRDDLGNYSDRLDSKHAEELQRTYNQ